jgi:hypothetical protein
MPADQAKTLAKVRERLKSNDKGWTLVATSCVECGVEAARAAVRYYRCSKFVLVTACTAWQLICAPNARPNVFVRTPGHPQHIRSLCPSHGPHLHNRIREGLPTIRELSHGGSHGDGAVQAPVACPIDFAIPSKPSGPTISYGPSLLPAIRVISSASSSS